MCNKQEILSQTIVEFNQILDKWCDTFSTNYKPGKMRADRGEDIEQIVRNIIKQIAVATNTNLTAKRGNNDKKELHIQNTDIYKMHQVDVHIYLNDEFIAVIECKSYLDSCYYVRACDDFDLFRKFHYNVKKFIFTLENCIDPDTKTFIDYVKDNVCDDIFYMMNGKRSPVKPIYDTKYRKIINENNLLRFIDVIYDLCITPTENR